MKPPVFDRFVAIDWSGARGHHHRGIAVAVAEQGAAAPHLVQPAEPGGWSRLGVADWLTGQPERLLAGFDFSFAPPFMDRGAYLPGMDSPQDGPAFWAWLDRRCAGIDGGEDGGALPFILGPGRAHFWLGAADGPKADFLRHRVCERRFNDGGGGKASTVFDCVGAAQVAKASFAGMRVAHRLAGAGLAVWPFRPPGARTVVEIYTRAMIRHAGLPGAKVRDSGTLDGALAALGSAPARLAHCPTDHETDVLIAAAALRRLAPAPRWWAPPGMTTEIARTEGWTFGIG